MFMGIVAQLLRKLYFTEFHVFLQKSDCAQAPHSSKNQNILKEAVATVLANMPLSFQVESQVQRRLRII